LVATPSEILLNGRRVEGAGGLPREAILEHAAWECPTCTFANSCSTTSCEMCHMTRGGGWQVVNPATPELPPPTIPESLEDPFASMDPVAPSPDPVASINEEVDAEWHCQICTLKNPLADPACQACGSNRGAELMVTSSPLRRPAVPLEDDDIDFETLPERALDEALAPLALPISSNATSLEPAPDSPSPAPSVVPLTPEGPTTPRPEADFPVSSSVVPPVPHGCQCPLHRGVYQKEKHIGRGATGDVFMARHGDRLVALKQILVPEIVTREDLLIRAEQYQQLSHPHIIQYEDCFEHTDEFSAHFVVIVMPYFPLGEVTSLLQQHPRLEEALLLRIGVQIADALCYLHTLKPASIVHRDIKPENLLWDGHNVVLTDLETVRFMESTHCAGATGTYPYQSPEQIDRGLTSEKADVWGMGCVLFAMASKPLYPDVMHLESRRNDFDKWLKQRLSERGYSNSFATMVLMMLQPDPRKRVTAGQVRDHCRQLLEACKT